MRLTAVTPLGSHIYNVTDAAGAKHTVDLRAHDWNGSCTCDTFTGFCLPVLEMQRFAKRWRCDHLVGLRQWIMEHEVPPLVERQEKIVDIPVRYEPSNSDFGA